MKAVSLLVAAGLVLGHPPGLEGDVAVTLPDTGRIVAVGSVRALHDEGVSASLTTTRLGGGPLCVVHPAGPRASAVADTARRTLSDAGSGDLVRTLGLARSTAEGPPRGEGGERADTPSRGDAVSEAEAIDVVGGCGGMLLVGWETGELLERLRPASGASSPMERAVRSRWEQGAVLGAVGEAVSALGIPALVAGGSADAMAGGVRTTDTAVPGDSTVEALDVREGLGAVVRGIVDTRPLVEGRWGRLLVAALDHPRYPAGFGVSFASALVIDGGIGRVVGSPGVVLVDARGARRGAEGRVADVQVALLGSGSRIALDSLTWTAPEGAGPVPADGSVLPPPRLAAPFAPWRLAYLMVALARAPGTVTFSDPGWTLSLRPGQAFRAVATGDASVEFDEALLRSDGAGSPGSGVEAIPPGFTAGPLQVTLTWSGGGRR